MDTIKIHTINKNVPLKDTEVLFALEPWQAELNEYANQIVGQSRVYLQQSECAYGECNLGNLFTDAMLHAFINYASASVTKWSNITMALTTQGNFRVPIPPGKITYKQLVAMCPWENRLYALTLSGKHLLNVLEDSVASMNATHQKPKSSRFLQVSGFRITYNVAAEAGARVEKVNVRCADCAVPMYEPLDVNQYYRLVVMEYLANGKNGFTLISENAKDLEPGPFDLDALIDYLQVVGPVTAGLENRTSFIV